MKEARDYAENLKQHICHFFTVDNLFHLKRGGRVSAATAVVGTMLNIKPVLHVDHEGHLIAIGKAMGRKKSISALVDHMKELQTMGEHDPIFISHGDCIEDVNYLISLLKANFRGTRSSITTSGTSSARTRARALWHSSSSAHTVENGAWEGSLKAGRRRGTA